MQQTKALVILVLATIVLASNYEDESKLSSNMMNSIEKHNTLCTKLMEFKYHHDSSSRTVQELPNVANYIDSLKEVKKACFAAYSWYWNKRYYTICWKIDNMIQGIGPYEVKFKTTTELLWYHDDIAGELKKHKDTLAKLYNELNSYSQV